jgi:tetratricopeptide (TPR) repeat protein
MKIIIKIFSFLLISNLANSQTSNKNFRLGDEALVDKNYKEAIGHFNKVIKSNKQFEYAYLLRSQAYYGLKKYSKAIKDSEKVLEIKPEISSEEDYKAIWNIAVSYSSLEDYSEALIYFERAKEINPNDIKLYENSGFSYWGIGDLDSAEKEFKKMVELDSTSSKGYYGIGKTAYLNYEFERAIEAFDKAIDIDPKYAMAYQNRGTANFELGNLEDCCLDWNKAFELGVIQIEPFLKQYCK